MTATLADQFNQIACVEGTYGLLLVCEQSTLPLSICEVKCR